MRSLPRRAARGGKPLPVIIATANDAAELFGPCVEAAEGEALAVAFLDEARRLIAVDAFDADSHDRIRLPVRRIVGEALRIEARGLLVAHNHPSGNAQPSWDDVEATRELADTAGRLGIRLHDHLIFGGAEVCSLRALGLI